MDSIPSGVPLSKIPALEPPPGVKSNFVDPHSLTNAIIAVNVVFLALMLIALAIRIYTKGILLRSLWWDDYTALIAAAGSIAHSGVSIQQTGHGLGRHQWDVPLSFLTGNEIQVLHADAIISYPTYLCFKLSALLLYMRLFSVNQTLRWFIWVGIILQVIGYAAFTGQAIGLIAICTTAKNATTNTFCLNSYKVTYTQSIFSFLTDFYVLVLPIGVVLKLQMSLRRKMGVILIFMTGLLACAASLARAIIAIQRLHSKDTLYGAGLVTVFSAVEMNTAIIAGALTTLPPFLSKSNAVPLAHSAIYSIRNRLLGRSKTSISSRKSKQSDGESKIHDDEGSYTELNERPKPQAALWQEGGSTGGKGSGIVRTDDYEVAVHPDLSAARGHVPV